MTPAILLDEDGLLAIDKPAGLESTGRTPDDPGGLQHHVATALRRPVWLVHQLDRETSGVLLMVRRRALVAVWQARLAERSTQKRYVALVHGTGARDGTLDGALRYDRGARRWAVHPEGKAARTHVEVRARSSDACLVLATLETGRTHQARVHLATAGAPLIGERRYVTPPDVSHPRHALHLREIRLASGPRLVSALPEDLCALAARRGLADAAAEFTSG